MLQKSKNWLFDLSNLGVIPGYDADDVSRKIVFSNVVFISLPIVYLIFMVIDYESYQIPINELRFDQFVVPIIIVVCFLGLWLNRVGKSTSSRILFIVLWPILLHLIPIKLLQTPSDYYLAYPFGIVFHSMLIQLMFSYRHERFLFLFFMLINLLGMISAPSILMYFDLDHDIPSGMINYKYYFYDGILYWLLFNLVTFYILHVIESYIISVNTSKALIEKQKEALNELNLNLESLVSHRTAVLEEQNEKLKQYAFFNAHLLRGPFCRIQGLIQLQDLSNGDIHLDREIKTKLSDSIEELDARIKEIQKLVETKEMDVD